MREMVTAVAAALAVLFLPALAVGQEPVKSFDQLDTRLKIGDKIAVTDAQGRDVKGKIRELTPSALVLDRDGGRSYLAGDVRLVREDVGRNTGKGALWGLAVGGGVGGLFLLAAGQGWCDSDDCEYGYVLMAPIAVGAGAGIGALVGSMTPKNGRVVYRAPGAQAAARLSVIPVVTPRAKGVVVSFVF